MLVLLLLFTSAAQAATIADCPSGDPDYHNLQLVSPATTLVHLFEWKWTDIKAECAGFLKDAGYGAVQISPPNEHAQIGPWWESYQPVSYKLYSRRGTEAELRDMIATCNANGIRIIVDAVINHMTGGGNNGTGAASSFYNGATLDYPGVPFSAWDFNEACNQNNPPCNSYCNHGISNYQDATEVRNCMLVGLHDLAHSKSYVRGKIVDYMNSLIDAGVAGFRVDAAK